MKTAHLLSQKTIRLDTLHDLFGLSKNWVLCAWPISYNSSVSFIFRDETEGDVTDGDSDQAYHFIVFTVDDFNFHNIQKKELCLYGVALVSIFFWENGYAVCTRDKFDNCIVFFYDTHEQTDFHINLGQNVTRFMLTKDGRLAVGYAPGYGDDSPSFAVLSPIGKPIYECKENSAKACMDLTIDQEGNIWASCFPDTATYKITPNAEVHKILAPVSASSSISPFQLNGKQAIIYGFDNEDCYAPVNYIYFDGELSEAVFDDLENTDILGISSYAGLLILLDSHNVLHFYDLDHLDKTLSK